MIDFIPRSSQQSRARRRRMALGTVLFVVVAGGLAQLVALSHRRLAALDTEIAPLREQVAALREEAEAREREEPKDNMPSAANLRLLEKIQSPVPVLMVVMRTAEAMPPAIGLRSISFAAQPVDPLPLDARQRERARAIPQAAKPTVVTLEGLAPDDVEIAKFIGQLDRQALFANIKLGYSRPTEGGEFESREFQITAEIPLDRRFVVVDSREVRHDD